MTIVKKLWFMFEVFNPKEASKVFFTIFSERLFIYTFLKRLFIFALQLREFHLINLFSCLITRFYFFRYRDIVIAIDSGH